MIPAERREYIAPFARHPPDCRAGVIPLPDVDEADLRWLMIPEAPDVDALLAGLIHRPPWHARAACRGMGPALFFPDRGESSDEAKAICARCAVRSECFDAAPLHGIWAGLSARGRRVLRRGAA